MDAKSTTVRVAVVQAGSVPFDTGACIDKAVKLTADAAATGARVVLFPEAFVAGYPKGLSYGLALDDFGCYGGSSGCGRAVAAIATVKRYYRYRLSLRVPAAKSNI